MGDNYDPGAGGGFGYDINYDPTNPDTAGLPPPGTATNPQPTGSGFGLDSLWGTLQKGVQSGQQMYGSLSGPAPGAASANQQAKQSMASSATLQKYLPWVIGGAVLLLVIGMVARK
jgi:hypothetical protein